MTCPRSSSQLVRDALPDCLTPDAALYHFPLVMGVKGSCGSLGALVQGKGKSDNPKPWPRKSLRGKVGSFGTNQWA